MKINLPLWDDIGEAVDAFNGLRGKERASRKSPEWKALVAAMDKLQAREERVQRAILALHQEVVFDPATLFEHETGEDDEH